MKKFFAVLAFLLSALFLFAACTPTTPSEEGDGSDPSNKTEYTLPLEDGYNQLTIYWNNPNGYENCDIWIWYGDVAGQGYLFHECEYGAKVVVNIPEDIATVGFIIRTNCSDPGGTTWGTASKDGTDSDRSVSMRERETVIYTKAGDAKSYTSDDGGKTLKELKFIEIANLQDKTHIRVVASVAVRPTVDDVTLKDGAGNRIAIAEIETKGGTAFTITTGTALDLANEYTVEIAGIDDIATVVPLTYFSSPEFEAEYAYDGALGVELQSNKTIFRLWAPTAASVVLNLYAAGSGGTATQKIDLVRGEKGVWSHTANENLSGKYYTYTVKTSAGTNEVVDPYAVSAGVNGRRGMILDLDSTDPAGWSSAPFTPAGVVNYTDAEIWEIHVRDFSNNIKNSQYKGKFLAFTETGLKNEHGVSVGVDYLKELGVNYVHLLPSFDYATVDESTSGGFNWGYDPQNYNIPEGSYATDANDGAVRVKEFKQMVQALHAQGIGVIMDVVYNHTSGLDSNFNKIVPYYYYRFNSNGKASNGSGCGNETASERAMFRKFMIDSVTYWQKEYNVDGFRFDLMGLHDATTMQQIEKAVHAINPKAMLYGEGWTGGGTPLDSKQQSTLANIRTVNAKKQTNGVAMFSDVIRDAIKGSVFSLTDVGFATGAKASAAGAIRFGVNGGVNNTKDFKTTSQSWQAYSPTNVVNYASAHDNNTLWDRICAVYGEDQSTLETRLKYNRLSAAIVQTALGIPFMQAGEEMLRQKKNADGTYNENSYNASDAVNNLQWDLLKQGSAQYEMMQYYKGLIAFRKSSSVLRSATAENVCKLVEDKGACFSFTMTVGGETLFVVYNAGASAQSVSLPEGSWNLYIDGTRAGTTALASGVSGSQSVSGVSCYVYKKA